MNNAAKKLNRFPNQFKFTGYQSLLNLNDLGNHGLFQVLELAKDIKANPDHYSTVMKGKKAFALFQKHSTRNYCSFDIAVQELGGMRSTMHWDRTNIEKGELIDEALAMSALYDLLFVIADSHYGLCQIQKGSFVPVINAFTDLFHPCQVLADLLTLSELYEDYTDINLAFIGDGNNVCNSLINAAKISGLNLTVCTPDQYAPYTINRALLENHSNIKRVNEPKEAVKNADVIYTDTWVSLGKESEAKERIEAFSAYQVNAELLKHAPSDVNIFHCMPIQRNYEITDEIIDEHMSTILSQTQNKVHILKAIMCKLLKLV